MTNDTLSTAGDAVPYTKYRPLDIDNNPIEWDGSPAYAAAKMHEVLQYYKRTGLFGPLMADHSVLLSNGKTAVDYLNALPFVTGH